MAADTKSLVRKYVRIEPDRYQRSRVYLRLGRKHLPVSGPACGVPLTGVLDEPAQIDRLREEFVEAFTEFIRRVDEDREALNDILSKE